MKVRVDRDVCTGHALCFVQAPRLFVLDDDGFNQTPDIEVPTHLEQEAQAGAAACPERAIVIEE